MCGMTRFAMALNQPQVLLLCVSWSVWLFLARGVREVMYSLSRFAMTHSYASACLFVVVVAVGLPDAEGYGLTLFATTLNKPQVVMLCLCGCCCTRRVMYGLTRVAVMLCVCVWVVHLLFLLLLLVSPEAFKVMYGLAQPHMVLFVFFFEPASVIFFFLFCAFRVRGVYPSPLAFSSHLRTLPIHRRTCAQQIRGCGLTSVS
jgi:hypothetical protein